MRFTVTHSTFTLIVKVHQYPDHGNVFVYDTASKQFTSFDIEGDITISDIRAHAFHDLQASVFGDNLLPIHIASSLYRGEYN